MRKKGSMRHIILGLKIAVAVLPIIIKVLESRQQRRNPNP